MADAANRGIEDRRIKLGCTLPGESPAIFGDALRHLTQAATYLYQDSARYWYSTQPTVAKLAADRAEELKRHREKVLDEIRDRIREELRDSRNRGEFVRVHAFPGSSAEVSDERATALVILGPETEWSKEPKSPALAAAQNIFDTRGTLRESTRTQSYSSQLIGHGSRSWNRPTRNFLAWKSILDDAEGDRPSLNLDNFQRTQAKAQRKTADQTVQSRIGETYQILLAPDTG